MTNSVTFDPSIGGDGSTYTDDDDPSTGMGNGGHRDRFIPALANLVSTSGFVADTAFDVGAAAIAATAAKVAAEAAATAAATSSTGLIGTSTSSNSVGTGAKTFTTQSGKMFSAGAPIFIVDQANANNWMFGTITSYSGTSLVVNITATNGSGTLTAWNISVVGPRGISGSSGVTYLETVSGTNAATLETTFAINSTYEHYELDLIDIFALSGTPSLVLQVKVGGAWKTANYDYGLRLTTSSTGGDSGSTSASGITIGSLGAGSTDSCCGRVTVIMPSGASRFHPIDFKTIASVASVTKINDGGGHYTGAAGAIEALRVLASSGNITGTIRLYGVAKN